MKINDQGYIRRAEYLFGILADLIECQAQNYGYPLDIVGGELIPNGLNIRFNQNGLLPIAIIKHVQQQIGATKWDRAFGSVTYLWV